MKLQIVTGGTEIDEGKHENTEVVKGPEEKAPAKPSDAKPQEGQQRHDQEADFILTGHGQEVDIQKGQEPEAVAEAERQKGKKFTGVDQGPNPLRKNNLKKTNQGEQEVRMSEIQNPRGWRAPQKTLNGTKM